MGTTDVLGLVKTFYWDRRSYKGIFFEGKLRKVIKI